MNRISVPALAAFALLLVACPKKNTGADAGMDAAPMTADTATAAAAVDAGTAPAPTLATAKPVNAAKHDAGAGDGGAMAADAGKAPEQCCCKVGAKYSHSGQSECTTTMKGACVPAKECTDRECCCEARGKHSTEFSSDCTKLMQGKCVAKDQCK